MEKQTNVMLVVAHTRIPAAASDFSRRLRQHWSRKTPFSRRLRQHWSRKHHFRGACGAYNVILRRLRRANDDLDEVCGLHLPIFSRPL
jgi:hypothetical protein